MDGQTRQISKEIEDLNNTVNQTRPSTMIVYHDHTVEFRLRNARLVQHENQYINHINSMKRKKTWRMSVETGKPFNKIWHPFMT